MNSGMPMNMPNMNPGMPNMDINMGVFPPSGHPSGELNHIMDKLHHLEREIKKLDRRVDALEGGHNVYPTPLKHYEDGMDYGMMKDYPQYHSGNYML